MIIALEGIDGAGKSTAALDLSVSLRKRGIENVVIGSVSFAVYSSAAGEARRGPGSTSTAQQGWTPTMEDDLREMWEIRDELEERFGPQALCLSNAWDFAYRWESLGAPALEIGKVVIADRYIHTALVRDVLRGIDEAYVRTLYSFVPPPDLLIYLDTSPKIAYDRKIKNGLPIGYFEAGRDVVRRAGNLRLSFETFQGQCKKRYDKVLTGMPVVKIDGARPAAEAHAEIFTAVLTHLEQNKRD
jgi:thymidylate kinase